MPRPDSGGHGLPRNDADCRGADRAAPPAALPIGNLCEQSLRHGPRDRVDSARASQALSRATGARTLAAHAIRNHTGLEGALPEPLRAGAKSGGAGHQPGRFGATVQASAAGPRGTGPRASGKADRVCTSLSSCTTNRSSNPRTSQLLSAALPENERAQFAYDPNAVDWWDYWINIHVPALRKWVYPLIEGHAIESRQRRDFRFSRFRGSQRWLGRTGHASHMAIFLTGATGYIGSYLAAGLLEDYGESLNVLVRAADYPRGRTASVASAPAAFRLSYISRTPERAHPYFSRRSHRAAIRPGRRGLRRRWWPRPIPSSIARLRSIASPKRAA